MALPIGVTPPIGNTGAVPSTIPSDPITSQSQEPQPQQKSTVADIYDRVFSLNHEENPLAKVSELRGLVTQILQSLMEESTLSEEYNWLIIHDPLTMTRTDADKIYKLGRPASVCSAVVTRSGPLDSPGVEMGDFDAARR